MVTSWFWKQRLHGKPGEVSTFNGDVCAVHPNQAQLGYSSERPRGPPKSCPVVVSCFSSPYMKDVRFWIRWCCKWASHVIRFSRSMFPKRTWVKRVIWLWEQHPQIALFALWKATKQKLRSFQGTKVWSLKKEGQSGFHGGCMGFFPRIDLTML